MVLPSCRAISSFVHDGEVIAKIGDHKLYRSDLEGVIPKGANPDDSINLAKQFIESWAKDKAFLDIAEKSLSKSEKDVTDELEAYRQSLLRYRYEQHYIDERLDTVVTEQQILDYYNAHQENYRLERPVMKARFVSMPEDSPNSKLLKKLISSDNPEEVASIDSVAFNSALKYQNYSDRWVDAATLAKEFGTDYAEMLVHKSGSTIEMTDSKGNLDVAYVVDMIRTGGIAPLDYCRARIENSIISERKHSLLTTLEQDLIEDARSKDNFVIYSE